MAFNETLYQIISIVISVMLVIFAFLSLESKKLINAVIYLSSMSLMAVFVFVLLRAPDVAITEAVIGSGITTALFVFTLLGVKKISKPKENFDENIKEISREAGDVQ